MAVHRFGDVLVDIRGEGSPLVIVPGGPARHPDYLEDLGGLERDGYQLVFVFPRGVGEECSITDGARLSASHQAASLETVRRHLEVDAITLVAHSAGAAVAFNFAMQFPQGVARLVLITPSTHTVGLVGSTQELKEQLTKQVDQPWYQTAVRAMDDIREFGVSSERRRALMPLIYGAWNSRAQDHDALEPSQSHPELARFYSADEPDPGAVREAMRRITCPVRIVVGELDPRPGLVTARDLTALFPDGRASVVAGAGHFPWVTQPLAFRSVLREALTT